MSEKSKKYIKKRKYKVVILIPFILGFIGFIQEAIDENIIINSRVIFDAAYKSMRMYVVEGPENANNILVAISRWVAPIMTLSGVVLLFNSLKIKSKLLLKGNENITVIYADEYGTDLLIDELGSEAIKGNENEFYRANNYIIAYDDDKKNLATYENNIEKLKGRNIYLKYENLKPYHLNDNNIKYFSFEDWISRVYWKDENIMDEVAMSSDSNATYNISIIGFGSMGQKILINGLLNNIFSNKQHIKYHIFGDSKKFKNIYHELDKMKMDEVIFYDKEWYEYPEVISSSQRVLVTAENFDMFTLVGELDFCMGNIPIHIISSKGLFKHMFKSENVKVFEFKDKLWSSKNIMEERLEKKAKLLNYRYAQKYSENVKSVDEEWNKLDNFTKGSNISSTDYNDIRLKMYEKWSANKNEAEKLTDWIEEMAELEHIRWCRYHILNNWSYGELEDGKTKDANRRIHTLICPYADLKPEEKAKDFDGVVFLMNDFLENKIDSKGESYD